MAPELMKSLSFLKESIMHLDYEKVSKVEFGPFIEDYLKMEQNWKSLGETFLKENEYYKKELSNITAENDRLRTLGSNLGELVFGFERDFENLPNSILKIKRLVNEYLKNLTEQFITFQDTLNNQRNEDKKFQTYGQLFKTNSVNFGQEKNMEVRNVPEDEYQDCPPNYHKIIKERVFENQEPRYTANHVQFSDQAMKRGLETAQNCCSPGDYVTSHGHLTFEGQPDHYQTNQTRASNIDSLKFKKNTEFLSYNKDHEPNKYIEYQDPSDGQQ